MQVFHNVLDCKKVTVLTKEDFRAVVGNEQYKEFLNWARRTAPEDELDGCPVLRIGSYFPTLQEHEAQEIVDCDCTMEIQEIFYQLKKFFKIKDDVEDIIFEMVGTHALDDELLID